MTGPRACGACSLCCTVLRVDELRKLGGTPCVHLQAGGAGAQRGKPSGAQRGEAERRSDGWAERRSDGRAAGGCGIYERRPAVCRAYQCLWLRGSLRDEDRPDRLGAVLDLVSQGSAVWLEIREAQPGAFERSARLREIAKEYRRSLPVRIGDTADVLDPDRRFRVLLPAGEERLVDGEWTTVIRPGLPETRVRLPRIERWLRRASLAWRRWRVADYRGADRS